MTRLTRLLAPLMLVAGLASQPASASLVLDLNTGGTAFPCGTCGPLGDTFGWSFRVINPITINQLGVWDAGANGLGLPSSRVGLWTAAGALLASATVTDASEQVASASADGEWLFEGIASLTLVPGSYVIGSVNIAAAPLAQTNAPFTTTADIALTGGVQGPNNAGLAFPGSSFRIPIFGPTMRLAENNVPEPAGVALVGLGLALMAFRRRSSEATGQA